MITRELILDVMPLATGVVDAFIDPLTEACSRWGIDNEDRVAAFVAQAAHESGQLRYLTENLNYSATGLVATWPSRFRHRRNGDAADLEVGADGLAIAEAFHRRPEAIANRVYSRRMGNGDEASGDGWNYRGRGIFGITGAANYARASTAVTGDRGTYLRAPDLVATPEHACATAGWYWSAHNLNAYADGGDFQGLTRAINGGLIGLEDRVVFWHRAIASMA